MAIDEKVIDQLLAEHGHRAEDIVGEQGLLKKLTKALLERALQAELSDHLGYEDARSGGVWVGELAKREEPEEAEGGFWGVGVGDAARPQGDV